MKLPKNKDDRKIKIKAESITKILIKDEKFIFYFVKPFLIDYILYINKFFEQNRDKINSINSSINTKFTANNSIEKSNKELLILDKLSFLIKVTEGFNIEQLVINKDFLNEQFSVVKKENKKYFDEQLEKTSDYFGNLYIEESKEIISYKDLYEKGNFLLNFVLNEKTKISVLNDFIYDDLKNNIVSEIKNKNDSVINNLIINNKTKDNYQNY